MTQHQPVALARPPASLAGAAGWLCSILIEAHDATSRLTLMKHKTQHQPVALARAPASLAGAAGWLCSIRLEAHDATPRLTLLFRRMAPWIRPVLSSGRCTTGACVCG